MKNSQKQTVRPFRWIAFVLLLVAGGSLAGAELTDDQAKDTLMSWLGRHATYGVAARCLSPKIVEHKNDGYTIDIVSGTCAGQTPGRILGRWRVDARSGDVFVQNANGKFVVPGAASSSQGAGASVREEKTVVVDGVKERWRLEWIGATKEVCPPDDAQMDGWGTCPCNGFEFAEEGQLDLVRNRPGAAVERLPLTPLFVNTEWVGGKAVLRRYPLRKGDGPDSENEDFAARVRARPLAPVMNLADYDHDGRATEFVLQVGAGPCGHRQSVVVGIQRREPRLHAFTAVEDSGQPLVLEHPDQWEKVRAAQADVELKLFGCGDHGSDEESAVRIRFGTDGLHVKRIQKNCD